jgi:hypothetical protein
VSRLWFSTLLGAAVLCSPQFDAALAADFGAPKDSYYYAQQPLAQGYVDVAGGIWNVNGSSYGAIGSSGALNIPIAGGWNLQPELSVLSVFSSSVGTSVTGVIHAFYRNPQSHALGVYGGGFGGGSPGGGFVVGLDGLLYMPRTTLYAQAGYFTGGTVGDGGQIVGTARYFPTDNTKLQGSVGYAASNAGISVFGISASAEMRFDQTPFSAFLTGTYLAGSNGMTGDAGIVMMGARMYFNNETLFQNDREGVTTGFVKLF